MQLNSKLLVRMCLDAQGFVDGQNLEKERQLPAISLGDFRRHQRLVVLDEIKQCSLRLKILGRKGGVRAHP